MSSHNSNLLLAIIGLSSDIKYLEIKKELFEPWGHQN